MRAVPPGETDPGPAWKRLAWFAGIAAASGLVTAVAAYGLRALLTP